MFFYVKWKQPNLLLETKLFKWTYVLEALKTKKKEKKDNKKGKKGEKKGEKKDIGELCTNNYELQTWYLIKNDCPSILKKNFEVH